MKNLKRIIFGIILVVAGTIFALNALEITDIDIFFEGWWTLFIIVPCFLNLVSGHDVAGNIAGLTLGVLLLLCTRDILDWSMMWKLFIPAIVVIIGLKCCSVAYSTSGEKRTEESKTAKSGKVMLYSRVET